MTLNISFKANHLKSHQDFSVGGLEGHVLAQKLQTLFKNKASVFPSHNQWIVEIQTAEDPIQIRVNASNRGEYDEVIACFPESANVQVIDHLWKWAADNSFNGKFEMYRAAA